VNDPHVAGDHGASDHGASDHGASNYGARHGAGYRGADNVTADVLVIGGGVIGLAIGWRAAQRGMRVTVADPDPGRGASHAAAGMLTPVAEAAYAERELFELGRVSLDRYPAFAAELAQETGLAVGFRQTGTLLVGYDADDMAAVSEHAVLRETFGAPSQRLSGRECRKAEPLLGPAVCGGLLVADDASVDPRRLTDALLAAMQKAGAVHLPERAVRLLTARDRAVGAELADGTAVSAAQVVLSAGWASASLPGLPAAAAPPVRPVKGQIVRLRPTSATLAAGLPPSLISRTVRGLTRGSSVYLVPRDDGELVVGATQEEMGTDTTVTAGGVWQLLRDARAIVPGITELEFAEAVAGLRPGTPDNAPVLGPSDLPGLVLATGHFRSGVLLAPVTADLIAELLATGASAAAASPFRPQRFGRQEGER
jgi:glycine oxidase